MRHPLAILKYSGTNKNIPSKIIIDKETFRIGYSKDNDLCLPFGHVSKYHAELRFNPNFQNFSIIDLGSTNGTYVQGEKIPPHLPFVLSNNVYIQFSEVLFKFKYSKEIFVEKAEENIYKSLKEEFNIKKELFEKGKIFKGSKNYQYQILEPIKVGKENSYLFKGLRVNDKTLVVLKFYPPEEMNNIKNVFRFITEAKIIISLEHENIVKGLDLYHDLEYCYLVMEYINGSSVLDLLKKRRKLPLELALKIVYQITKALIYLEEKKIFHRDIKPSNIIWQTNQKAKLVDFGIAKTHNISLTTKGYTLGTLCYMAPEQALGSKIDIRADIYSLGATFYHMITGSVPYEYSFVTTNKIGETFFMKQRIKEPPIRVDKLDSSIPSKIADLIQYMMEPKVEERISSPKLVLALLEEIEEDFNLV